MPPTITDRQAMLLKLLNSPTTLEQLVETINENDTYRVSYQTIWREVDELERRGLVNCLPFKQGKANVYQSNFATLEEEGSVIEFKLGTSKPVKWTQIITGVRHENFSLKYMTEQFANIMNHMIMRSRHQEKGEEIRMSAPNEQVMQEMLIYYRSQLLRTAGFIDQLLASPVWDGKAFKLAGSIETEKMFEWDNEFFHWFAENEPMLREFGAVRSAT